MKQEIFDKLKQALNNYENLNEIINNEEFYFQMAADKYNEFISLPQIGEKKTKELTQKVVELKSSNSFNFKTFIEENKGEPEVYKLLFVIGELVSYIDLNAANKNELNKYEDKRTIAKIGVYQNDWAINLLNLKESGNIDNLSPAIKNSIRYLINPDKILNIFSERHKKLMEMFIFQNTDTNLNFDELAIKELASLNVNVKNEKNRPLVYERILYSSDIRQIWEYNKTIWKISHGDVEFKRDVKEKFLKENIVVVGKDTGKYQGKSFINTMKKGDLFYLCYGNRGIKLIGRISSDASPLTGYDVDDDYMKRSYEIIKQSIDSNPYKGISKGWTPNYNSTCFSVKEDNLAIFEEKLLKPYFNMSLDELFSSEPISKIVPNEITPELPSLPEKIDNIYDDLNYIIYGPPGTGKTYNTINYAVAIIENKEVEILQVEDYKTVKERYEKYKSGKQIVFTTFHQSFGYEEFIEGIKPRLDNGCSGEISYYISEGIFKQFCTEAKKYRDKKYVFIIDEINRGNISKIFGELITLIEKSKRIGKEEETKIVLPYSKEEFGVPKNVFILGTMNTADRSIALLDTALRRRFKFIEMMPDIDVFKKLNDNQDLIVEGINIKNMLEMINNRIEILYDREHTIGQSYFIDLINNNSIDNLQEIFMHKIIPLLQEYFFDDYEKIRMILGDNQTENEDIQFINVSSIPKDIFGKKYDSEILEDRKVYSLNMSAFSNCEAYLKIYDLNFGMVKDE